MANGNTTPSRLGQVNGAGDALALFLKVFSGEVLSWFNDRTVMMGRHRVKTIQSGKSAQFPAIGKATANYHVVGEDILDAGNSYLSTIGHNEKTIHIDEILTSAVFTADIDEWMNHYDTRSEYARQLGAVLAETADKYIMQVLGRAAVASATITGGAGGTSINGGANLEIDPDLLTDGIYQAAKVLDENNVPREGRYALITPDMYWRLVRMGGSYGASAPIEVASAEYSPGNANVAAGKIYQLAGMELVPSNIWADIQNTNVAGVTGQRGDQGNNYAINLTNVRAICFQQQAVGTVKMRDLVIRSEYQLSHLGNLMVAQYAMGHGVLRPECVVQLKDL